MKNLILSLTLFLGFVTIGHCDDPPPFNPNSPDSIPIDGGVSILLAGAVGYGIKKVNVKKSDVSETK